MGQHKPECSPVLIRKGWKVREHEEKEMEKEEKREEEEEEGQRMDAGRMGKEYSGRRRARRIGEARWEFL